MLGRTDLKPSSKPWGNPTYSEKKTPSSPFSKLVLPPISQVHVYDIVSYFGLSEPKKW